MKRYPVYASCAILLAVGTLIAQDTPRADDPLGGAKRPNPQLELKRLEQYKRVHQLAIRYLLLGREDDARQLITHFLDRQPRDAESHFVKGVVAARRGEYEKAEDEFQQAIEYGLPPGRVIVGREASLGGYAAEPEYQRHIEQHASGLIHGPLLGNLTDHSAAIWVRTADEARVTVLISQAADLGGATRYTGDASEDRDYTAVVDVGGLEPETIYHYGIQIGDGPIKRGPEQRICTFSAAGEPTRFAIAFGGGAGYVPKHERMWDTIASIDPRALLLLGDNVYIDDPESPVMQRYTYHRRQSRPEWRRLTASTPVFTIWDDHDFSTNDSWGGPQIDVPAWKLNYSWPIYVENWANPPYAGGPDQPGCYYAFSIGDVDFIMLDCRYYRTDPAGERPSMLGPVQLAWLKQQLSNSSGTFKVICSSVPWDYRTKGDSRDTWNGYRAEREEIFSFLTEHGVEGIVLMSADRHRSDAWRIERPDDYSLYEFNSSRLTNIHVHATTTKQGAIFSYNQKQSFGLVTFDTVAADPQVTYDVVSIDGERVHSMTVKRSQLRAE